MTTETRSKHSSTCQNAAMKGVPAFLQSLYQIVDDEGSNNLIHWSQDGESFFVQEPDQLAKELLGTWFKHKNYSSFVRQLNNYGFRKIFHLQQGTLRSNGAHEYHHYMHSEFRRDRQDLLDRIQRKSQPVQSSEVCDSSYPASIKKEEPTVTEMVPAGDVSQGRLLETILLDVSILKRRQGELEADNGSLRDEIKTIKVAMQQQQELMLRLLAGFGLVPTAGHHWTTTRGNDQLMIQGVEEKESNGKAEIGEGAAPLSGSMDSLNGDYTVSSPFHLSQPNSPTSTDRALSPTSCSPSSSLGSLNQSIGRLDVVPGNNETALLNCSSSEPSNQALDISGDSPFLYGPLHFFSETNSYDFDAKFGDPSAESVSGLNENHGMGEIYPEFLNDFTSSNVGNNGTITASDASLNVDATSSMQTTSGFSGAPFAPGDTTHTTVNTIRRKRKASLVDELQRTGPECVPHPPMSPVSPYGTETQADQSIVHSTYPWDGFMLDSRSPKRGKFTLASKEDN